MQWYTIETTWSKERIKTTKKQRFKYIQEASICLHPHDPSQTLTGVYNHPTRFEPDFLFVQALLRVRDTKERLKIAVQLPMLPLSIIRGTSEVIRAQRTSEFNAFIAAVVSVPKLRVLPSLVLLLAPDDIGSQTTLCASATPHFSR